MTTTRQASWAVHKFGGTSVNGSERYRHVGELLAQARAAEAETRLGVVVSAMSKVTDSLLELVDLAQKRNDAYLTRANELLARHLQTASELFGATPEFDRLKAAIDADFTEMLEILRGVYLSRVSSEATRELISGQGEIWSAQLLDGHLRKSGIRSTWLNARNVLCVESGETSVNVDWARSEAATRRWIEENAAAADVVVITGFVAATQDGIPTTLKRNGSDYSGSIFGRLLQARDVTIWTDVDGVLSADPRLVPEAMVLEHLSYDEATELAYFGAKVVHPRTMAPAIEGRIPIWIRNTFNPSHPGTLIHDRDSLSKAGKSPRGPVTGFSTIERIALLNVEGTGMIGVPGVAHRLFGALREVGVSVVMISQASSEHSICFAVPSDQAQLARQTIERAFFAELHHGQIQKVEVLEECAILAAVGDAMVEHPGVAGRFLGALGSARVNVCAIAQGSSERNISVVIARKDSTRALRAAHAAFYLSSTTLSIGVIGPGLIGGTLLDQLSQEIERLRKDHRLDLRVRGVLNRSRMLLEEKELPLDDWKARLAKNGTAADLLAFVDHVHAAHIPHAVIVDCTADAEVPRHYAEWISRGIHIVTPNKKGNTGSLAEYRRLHDAARRQSRHYLYETTVGAGLPILSTLRDLIQTGDRILSVEGILSGTLSFIFNNWNGKNPFSEAVREARRLGYTEPDPRDDLSGTDVARKLVILAREMGLAIELDQVTVESLVPDALRALSVDAYLNQLPSFDAPMLKRLEAAQARNEELRYVGVISLENGQPRAFVQLNAYPAAHPFARLRGSDNMVMFRTARYDRQPLVVQGPGAGPDVTAAGVFGDLLHLGSFLGAMLH